MKKRCTILALLLSGILFQGALAQTTPAHALKNVILHSEDGSALESATIVWRNGVIEAAGTNASVPFDAFVIDGGDSLHVYPGFIDGFTTWGSPELPKNLSRLPEPGNPPYDRAGVQPERKPAELLEDDKIFESGLKAGFTTAALSAKGFMLPGLVDVFYLSPDNTKDGLFKENIGLAGSFKPAPGGWGSGAYPSTLMGVMAKFRQVMFDATALQEHINYYRQNPEMPAPDRDLVLEAMFPLVNKTAPFLFEADSKEDIERLFTLQDQFGFNAVLVSGKEAYAKASELKSRNIPVLASIDFSDAPKWYKKDDNGEKEDEDKEKEQEEKAEEQEEISDEEKAYRERQLEAWKDEVTNIKKLRESGVKVGYASVGMALKDMPKKLEVLLNEGGLTEKDVVELMTLHTAQILGLDTSFGGIKKGKNASFSIFDKPMSEKKAKVVRSVSNGTIFEF